MLKEQKYKYWREVYYHGDPNVESKYITKELLILDLAELCIGSNGEYIGIESKLAKIKAKFGEESVQYQNTYKLAEFIKSHPIKL